ncbi:hypothetical protein [Tepidimonas sp.]|uniref:hypothetical protein n=1 Tax=Tepidimonas sp. TaxID=2002775 RepID=UPI0028CCE3DC|nr:hypothetical protein [Tepidimonas sp.]MDT7929163.1 hypothetical protein [Tepidimonas sp.]
MAAGLSTWDWDLRLDRQQLDPPALQVLGHSAATLPTLNMARWLDLIALADRWLFEHAWARHLSGQQPLLECELRLRHATVMRCPRSCAVRWWRAATMARRGGCRAYWPT